jgi:hypothetical protein
MPYPVGIQIGKMLDESTRFPKQAETRCYDEIYAIHIRNREDPARKPLLASDGGITLRLRGIWIETDEKRGVEVKKGSGNRTVLQSIPLQHPCFGSATDKKKPPRQTTPGQLR